MPDPAPVVFLFDIDNTLLDNDTVTAELKRFLLDVFGAECQQRYFAIFEDLRGKLGYADYLGALQQYRVEHPREPRLVELSYFLLDYPFADRLFPGAVEVIARMGHWGQTVILSDGDVVFQPRKVQRSGIYDAVNGRVLIYIHKEEQLDDVEKKYPARHYVFVDDKVRLLAALKKTWGSRVTTVFPRQGHYAKDAAALAKYPAPDITIEAIGELADYDLNRLLAAAR